MKILIYLHSDGQTCGRKVTNISLIVDKSFLEIFTADKAGRIDRNFRYYVREDRACGHEPGKGPRRLVSISVVDFQGRLIQNPGNYVS